MSSYNTRRIPRVRWSIGLLLGFGTLINYFDRLALSVAGPQLQAELGLSPAQMGVLFSAFFWTYALLQIPTGVSSTDWASLASADGARFSGLSPP